MVQAGPGSSPGKSRIKAYRLCPVGIGRTPKRLPSRPFPTTVWGLVGLNRPAVNALSELGWGYMHISYGRCGVPDTTPAPEIMYKHAQGAQKDLTATKKKIASIPCCITGSYFALGRVEELADLHLDDLRNIVQISLFFNSFWCKIGSAARNWSNSVPPEAATTFTFSSV